jgi:cobalt/nickel transport system permease protein
MHMSDALVSVAVGGSMAGVSTVAIGYSVKKIRTMDLEDKKIPMMGVMGAFIFAAQMINFTIPVTGSSGHIGGGVLLAALLGPYEALITLASVLLIQCLFFADGGLLALGCNIFNMGVITCFIVYPLIYKPFVKKTMTKKRITIAAILASVIGLQLGSFAVVLETYISGVTELPFTAFVTLMQPIHLAIGIVEGIITAAVLTFIYGIRKEILTDAITDTGKTSLSMKKVLILFAVITVFVGGVLSIFASSNPDGLEWSIQGVAGSNELEIDTDVHNTVESIQNKTSILPDYSIKGNDNGAVGTSFSGLLGGMITLAVVSLLGVAIIFYKKRKIQRLR